jgi:hypothetical protein
VPESALIGRPFVDPDEKIVRPRLDVLDAERSVGLDLEDEAYVGAGVGSLSGRPAGRDARRLADQVAEIVEPILAAGEFGGDGRLADDRPPGAAQGQPHCRRRRDFNHGGRTSAGGLHIWMFPFNQT